MKIRIRRLPMYSKCESKISSEGLRMDKLVVFFSRRGENYAVGNLTEGNAEHIANVIEKIAGADIYEIKPVLSYSNSYKECVQQAVAEFKSNARPEISNPIGSLDGYKTIYLCYPNWCGSFPRIVATFLQSHDLSGKTIYPMCTNEGSGMGRSVEELKRLAPNSVIKDGLSIRGTLAHSSDQLIREWLEK